MAMLERALPSPAPEITAGASAPRGSTAGPRATAVKPTTNGAGDPSTRAGPAADGRQPVADRLSALLQRSLQQRAGPRADDAARGRPRRVAPARQLQRLPVVRGTDARKRVRKAFIAAGRLALWQTFGTRLVDGIGAATIEQVGPAVVARLMDEQANDVEAVIRAINLIGVAELGNLQAGAGSAHVVRALGALRKPDEAEVKRAYATWLTRALAAGPVAYAPGGYAAFKARMMDGEIWDFATAAWTSLATSLLAVHSGAAPVDGAAFAAAKYAGQGVAGWVHNPDACTRLELQAIVGTPLAANFTRPYDDRARAALAQIAAHPAGALRIVADAVAVPARLGVWLDHLIASPDRATAAPRLDRLLAHSDGAVGMNNVLNHLDDLLPVAASVDALRTGALANLPFTTNVLRAGGLRGHFVKHVLGVQEAAHVATALAEARQWLGILGLAPAGAITRASLPNLGTGWYEWAIFRQHAQYLATYRLPWTASVNAADRPTSAAEVDALIGYFQTASAQAAADAASVAAAHEAGYEHDVSAAFDAARALGNRFLYFDAGTLKVNAHDGTRFMVAARTGGTFDLSTGFIPAGGPLAQYNRAWPQRMLRL